MFGAGFVVAFGSLVWFCFYFYFVYVFLVDKIQKTFKCPGLQTKSMAEVVIAGVRKFRPPKEIAIVVKLSDEEQKNLRGDPAGFNKRLQMAEGLIIAYCGWVFGMNFKSDQMLARMQVSKASLHPDHTRQMAQGTVPRNILDDKKTAKNTGKRAKRP